MFLLSKRETELKKYTINPCDGVTTDILTFDNFYLKPDTISINQEDIVEGSLVYRDPEVIPVYKFLSELTNRPFNEKIKVIRGNIARFFTYNTTQYFSHAGASKVAIVNLSSPLEEMEVSFYMRKNEQEIEEMISNGEISVYHEHERTTPADFYHNCFTDDQLADENCFTGFTLNLKYNQVFIYDPQVFSIEGNMTKYQVFTLY